MENADTDLKTPTLPELPNSLDAEAEAKAHVTGLTDMQLSHALNACLDEINARDLLNDSYKRTAVSIRTNVYKNVIYAMAGLKR